jgi:hypothetical protein
VLAEHLLGLRIGDLLVIDAHEQKGVDFEGRTELRVHVVLNAADEEAMRESAGSLRSQVTEFARRTGIKVVLTHTPPAAV